MAKATTYNTSGNRESLSDIISILEPESTPFVSLIKKGKATGTFFEMQVDKLNSVEFSGIEEGEDVGNHLKINLLTARKSGITCKNLEIPSWFQTWRR